LALAEELLVTVLTVERVVWFWVEGDVEEEALAGVELTPEVPDVRLGVVAFADALDERLEVVPDAAAAEVERVEVVAEVERPGVVEVVAVVERVEVVAEVERLGVVEVIERVEVVAEVERLGVVPVLTALRVVVEELVAVVALGRVVVVRLTDEPEDEVWRLGVEEETERLEELELEALERVWVEGAAVERLEVEPTEVERL